MPKISTEKKQKKKQAESPVASPVAAKKAKKKPTITPLVKYGERIEPLLNGPKRKGFKHLRGHIRRNFNIAPKAATAIDGIMTLFADYLLESIDHFRAHATPKRESVMAKDVFAAARACSASRDEMIDFARESIQSYNDSFPAEQQ